MRGERWYQLIGVDTGPLLKEHNQAAERHTLERVLITEDGDVLSDLSAKDAIDLDVRKLLSEGLAFEKDLCLALEQLDLNELVIIRQPAKVRQCF